MGEITGNTNNFNNKYKQVRPLSTFDLDAARQNIVGQRSFHFFGFNDAVGTSWESPVESLLSEAPIAKARRV